MLNPDESDVHQWIVRRGTLVEYLKLRVLPLLVYLIALTAGASLILLRAANRGRFAATATLTVIATPVMMYLLYEHVKRSLRQRGEVASFRLTQADIDRLWPMNRPRITNSGLMLNCGLVIGGASVSCRIAGQEVQIPPSLAPVVIVTFWRSSVIGVEVPTEQGKPLVRRAVGWMVPRGESTRR
jgi:hypothetical protein